MVTDAKRERWTRLIADYEASELTQREFASERGISYSNLRNWIYRLRQASRPLVDPAAAPESSRQELPAAALAGDSRLVPVRVVASAPKARGAKAEVLVPDDVVLLELALPSGATLRFPAGTDLAYLRALAGAL